MRLAEDLYGYAKCGAFIGEAISRHRPRRVLDLGCGSGEKLTVPVARASRHVDFVAVDADERSIAHARALDAPPNLEFKTLAELDPRERFDLVIASEIVEHVESPDAFLAGLRERLAPDGRVVLTLPNGYGASELAAAAESMLSLSGVLPLARRLKHALQGRSPADAAGRDTLAVSPHINFFSWRAVRRLIRDAGFRIECYRPRVLFCGFGFEYAIRGERALRWNAGAADRVPAALVSGWMFVLEPEDAPTAAASPYRRGPLARTRRWLNEKRCGLR